MVREYDGPKIGYSRYQWRPAIPPRELEVWGFIAQGLDNGQIAERMVIQRKSVENYVNQLYTSLRLGGSAGSKRVKAAMLYLTKGLGLDLL